MQFLRSGSPNTVAAPVAAAEVIVCDQCHAPLGDKSVLTREASGVIRRFCPDDVCIGIWRQGHRLIFRGT